MLPGAGHELSVVGGLALADEPAQRERLALVQPGESGDGVDEGELAEAFWISRENIDEIQSTISLTKTMISNFKKYGFALKK